MQCATHPKDITQYLDIAQRTGAFKSRELDILHETLIDCWNNTGTEYLLVEEKRDNKLVGFAIFGELEWTDFSWEMYWIIVDKDFHGQAIGKKLLRSIEEFIKRLYPYAILVAETSSIKEYNSARAYYRKSGFTEVGRIPHYYDYEDDLVTYYKVIKKSADMQISDNKSDGIVKV